MNSNELSWNWVVRRWDGEQWPEKRITIGTDDGHAIFINARYAGDVAEQANIAAAAPDMYNVLATAPFPSELNFADPESEIQYREWFESNIAAQSKAEGQTR